MIQKPYEVIIIGSGATGGMAALTMAKAGIRVLIVEKGPELSPEIAFGTEPCNTLRRLLGLANGNYQSQPQHPGFWKSNPLLYANKKVNPYTHPSDAPFIWTQGNQVGGRSLTWGGITLRLSNEDFKDSIDNKYNLEWPINYQDLNKHYSDIETFLKVHGKKDYLEQVPDGEFINNLPFTHSEEEFGAKIKYVLNGGKCNIGLESTIIDLSKKPTILRLGGLEIEKIKKVLDKKINLNINPKKKISSGQSRLHYSPGVPLKMNVKKPKNTEAFVLIKKRNINSKNYYYLSKNNNLKEAARNLYSCLRRIKNQGFKSIAVEKITNEGLGKTINDRLIRASKYKNV